MLFQSNRTKKRLMKLRGFLWQVYSALMLRFTPWHWWLLYRQIEALKMDRLQVGCGNVILKGWLNLTYEKREEYGRIKNRQGGLWLNFNALNPLPIPKESIQYLAASHFIEHIDLNAGLEFLKRVFPLMRSGGVIRLSCPDLELYASHYLRKDKGFFEDPAIRKACTFKNAATYGEIFIAKAYDSGGAHRWFYDAQSLIHILEKNGFKQARRVKRLESAIPDIELIELPEREVETVYVEAKKMA